MTSKNVNKDQIQKQLHNHSEDLVLENLKYLLKKDYPEVCSCDQCLLDMASFTLNRMPAKYISTHKGNIHAKISKFEQQYQVDLLTYLAKAINTVKENPSADCESNNS